MNTTKSLTGTLALTLGLLVLFTSGCGKEYKADIVTQNSRLFALGKPGSYYDEKQGKSVDFVLPDEAVFYDDYGLKGYDINYDDDHLVGLGCDLTELYWNVHFLDAKNGQTETIRCCGFDSRRRTKSHRQTLPSSNGFGKHGRFLTSR